MTYYIVTIGIHCNEPGVIGYKTIVTDTTPYMALIEERIRVADQVKNNKRFLEGHSVSLVFACEATEEEYNLYNYPYGKNDF